LKVDGPQIFLEVGPGQVLKMLAMQHEEINSSFVVATTRRLVERKDDVVVLRTALGELWERGYLVEWNRVYAQEACRKVSLPSYPFLRSSYWIADSSIKKSVVGGVHSVENNASLSDEGKDSYAKERIQTGDDISDNVRHIFLKLTGLTEELIENSTFSELGVDSLALVQFASSLKEEFNLPISFRQLSAETPTLNSLSNHIIKSRGAQPVENASGELKNLISIQPRGSKIPFILVHGDDANDLLPNCLDKDQPCYGYLHQGADGEAFKYTSVEDIADHYLNELKQIVPQGPYILGGFSFGGLVAYEMTRKLTEAGDYIPVLIMLDTFHPNLLSEINRIKSIRQLVGRIIKSSRNVTRSIGYMYHTKIRLYRNQPISPEFRTRYILSHYMTAALKYKPLLIDSPIVLLRAMDSISDDPQNGWSEMANLKIDSVLVPGDHLSMIRSPENFETLAKILFRAIEDAQK
jgi:thioesterase domain-containing protein/acyl carrier protein